MKTSPFPRTLALALTGILTLSLGACVCPDGNWDDQHGSDDDWSWPPPTPPNTDPRPPSKPAKDAGTSRPDAGTTNTVDAGAPKPVDAGTPNSQVDAGGGTPPRDAGAANDGASCPSHMCGATPVCQFDNQCGPAGRCRNGACEHGCGTAADCGTGQTCAGGFCVTPSTPGGQCVYDRDCGGAATCINGNCRARCTSDESCAASGDRCVAGVCKPDTGPRPQCRASSECPAGQDCINAVCRTPCVADVECCEGTSGSACRAGVCVTEHEVAPQCRLASQCGAAQSCIDGICGLD